MTVSEDSLLDLDFGVTRYSSRGLTQTLEPDEATRKLRRTINGRLDDLSASQFRKYVSSIQCRDMASPALGGIWPGMQVVVDCIVELAYETSTGGADRTVVPGSEREEENFTFYRPRLTMRVVNFSIDRDQWNAVVGWTLELAEV